MDDLVEFNLESLANWRGLTELEKFEHIEQEISKREIPVVIGLPTRILNRHCEERNITGRMDMLHSITEQYKAFTAVSFDSVDKTIKLNPVSKEAFTVSPNTHQVHTAFLTEDRWIGDKLFSELRGILCFYILESAAENNTSLQPLIDAGHIHD